MDISHYRGIARIAVLLVRWKLRRAGLLAEAAQPMYTFGLVPKKRGRTSSTRLLQLAEVERLPRAKN